MGPVIAEEDGRKKASGDAAVMRTKGSVMILPVFLKSVIP
jgi:hypothetical protein